MYWKLDEDGEGIEKVKGQKWWSRSDQKLAIRERHETASGIPTV